MRNQLRRGLSVLVLGVWAAAVLSGLGLLWAYGATAGSGGQAPQRWPSSSRIERARERATLVMAVHPRCPCTRASLTELARLLAEAEGRVDAHVLFLAPGAMPPGWERSNLWTAAGRIPGVQLVRDSEGTEAARFGLETSGHALLYDARGVLRFSGGITAARGHEGDNAGLDAVRTALSGYAGPAAVHPVFGCPIFTGSAQSPREERR